MDFELTNEEKEFREAVCAFLDEEVTKEVVEESEMGLGFGPHSWELMRKLGAKGLLAPTFPKDFGGLGLSRIYRYIVQQELDYRNALAFLKGIGLVGVDMAGPVILRHGSEELKREFLPKIAGGKIDFALGYTEPDAGSDLASICLRAGEAGEESIVANRKPVEEGCNCKTEPDNASPPPLISMQVVEDEKEFIVTGQKTFNTGCHYAQYHWLAARTDPKALPHKGISIFIVDLKSPGITIKPLWEISEKRTNEVFYDNVSVPKRNLVGEKGMGWYYMTEALNLERMVVLGGAERVYGQLLEYTKTTDKNGLPISKDPVVKEKLVDLSIEMNVARNFIRHVVWLQDKGKDCATETAMLKVVVCELYQKLARRGMEILGIRGLLRKGADHSILGGMCEHFLRDTYVMTIGGGTSEVMRNIIAKRGLMLPQ